MRAKGVEPMASSKAILKKWRLRFNVQHWFKHEGGMGNIEFTADPNDVVEGMVHQCKDEHLAPLDAVEAYGIGYDRIIVELETESGMEQAFTYIGLPDFLDDSCLPTQRYLNIILKGAEAARLSSSYIDKLREHPIFTSRDYQDFEFPENKGREYNRQSLASETYLTALAGAVFDMRGSRSQLDCLQGLFGGKDMTLFHLKRHDSSDGTETLEDVINQRISKEGKAYLNAYLNEYAREFKYVGRYHYTES